MFKVTGEIEIKEETVENMLIGAFEGGSNYWYEILKFNAPKNFNLSSPDMKEFRHVSYPINFGGSLVVGVKGEDIHDSLDRNTINFGLEVMKNKYPKHFNDMIEENDDCVTADVFLQCCLFSEIVYG